MTIMALFLSATTCCVDVKLPALLSDYMVLQRDKPVPIWGWAEAKLVAANQVRVRSESVPLPVAVRYAWADNPVCNLVSKDRLPVTPFRSDDWLGVTVDAR
ncbi:MAG: hypothetical protein GXP28_04180 [Planctomycetes bacterium]|nr:hypothetical protein [Planctomycetota bacterium]